MSITDELREYALGLDERNRVRCDLEHIADRIDAAYQKAEEEWQAKDGQSWLHGYYECHAELMEGNEVIAADLERAGWIQLPKDADGVTIHLGDELEFRNGDRTVRGTVQALSDCWIVFGEGPYYGVKSCHHAQPDSWERIIEDATALGAQMGRRTMQVDDLVERCKRLAGEGA